MWPWDLQIFLRDSLLQSHNFGSHHLLEGGRAIRLIEGDLSQSLSGECFYIYTSTKSDAITAFSDTEASGSDMIYVLLLPGNPESLSLLKAIDSHNTGNDGVAFPVCLPDLSHPKAFSRLSFQAYHLLRRKNPSSPFHGQPQGPHLQQSAFTIASVPENDKVSFALRWPAPVLDIIEGERTLHIAYWLDSAAKSAFVWCMDDCGQAWRKHEWQYDSTEMGVQDVWAFAMVFTGMANVHWRLAIVRYGDLTYPEVQGECRRVTSCWLLIVL